MNFKIIFFTIYIFIFYPTFSQNDTTYFNKEWQVTSKDSAIYWSMQFPDSGHFITHYMSGERSGDFEILKGKRHGVNLFYHKNGNISSKLLFNNGILTGKLFSYYPSGKPKEEGEYLINEYFIYNFWDSTGVQLVKDGTGIYIYYEETTLTLKAKGEVKNNKKDNYWSYYHDNGLIKEEGNYISNQKNGEWKGWNENGELQYKETYKNGILYNGVSYVKNDSITYKNLNTTACYPLGMEELSKKLTKKLKVIYLKTNRRYNKSTKMISFIVTVEEDGSITKVTAIKDILPKLDEEVIKFLKETSPWIPSYNRGKPQKMDVLVNFYFNRKRSRK